MTVNIYNQLRSQPQPITALPAFRVILSTGNSDEGTAQLQPITRLPTSKLLMHRPSCHQTLRRRCPQIYPRSGQNLVSSLISMPTTCCAAPSITMMTTASSGTRAMVKATRTYTMSLPPGRSRAFGTRATASTSTLAIPTTSTCFPVMLEANNAFITSISPERSSLSIMTTTWTTNTYTLTPLSTTTSKCVTTMVEATRSLTFLSDFGRNSSHHSQD
jgi:hypothetical protein